MTDRDDSQFHTGQPVWVMEPDGSQRPGEYVGEGQSNVGADQDTDANTKRTRNVDQEGTR